MLDAQYLMIAAQCLMIDAQCPNTKRDGKLAVNITGMPQAHTQDKIAA